MKQCFTFGPWSLIYYEAYIEESDAVAGNVILKAEAADGCWDPSGAITSLSTLFEPREAKPRIKRRSLLRGKPGVEFKPNGDAMVKTQ